MKITLIKWDNIQTLILPPKIYGHFELKDDDSEKNETLISIEGITDQWLLRSGDKAAVLDQTNQEVQQIILQKNSFYKILIRESKEQALILTEPITEDRQSFNKYKLPARGKIRLGKLDENEISYQSQFISRHHATILIDRESLIIRDEKSANGTFVNGKRIAEAILKAGDTISIMGLVLIIGNDFLAVNNPDQKVIINTKVLSVYQQPQIVERSAYDDNKSALQSGYSVYRVPRFKREIKPLELRIDAPPNPVRSENIPIYLMIGPAITMGMTSVTFGVMAVTNVLISGGSMFSAVPSLVMSGGMLAGTVLWPTLTRKYEKRKLIENEKNRNNRYLAYLKQFEEQIDNETQNQAEILNENFKSPEILSMRIQSNDGTLWERTSEQNDFLEVRLGMGKLPIQIKLDYPQEQFSMENDNLKNKMYQIVKRPKLLENVPVTLVLGKEKNYGFLGNSYDRICFFKNILVQLVTLHSYEEVNLVFLYSENQEEIFSPLRWLPHVWNSYRSIRMIGRNAKEIKEIGFFLEKEISRRQELDEETREMQTKILVFVMEENIGSQADFVQRILEDKKFLGISVLSFYHEFNSLAKECSKVIEIRDGASRKFDREDTSGVYQSFRPELPDFDLDQLCRDISGVHLEAKEREENFPKVLEFLDMYQVGKVEHLNCLSRWAENDPTISLESMVGVNERGEGFTIDFHEKYHGPHGLIAGMTGSGKSEFIITFILSMAVNYHPYEVAFILIDYKGGGMADVFKNLPHLAGTITNLDGREVKRSLISIQSEIIRRQAIFKEAGIRLNMTNIDIYEYQRLYRDKLVSIPLQHLFIITDEFAELKMQQPDFMEQLVSAARIGRSLGIHLILATQKPSGVVDAQIWSNSRLKICLKVQERTDSLDMINRADAAELKDTGRFFMQVGFNELFETGQSAWSGAPYYSQENWTKPVDDGIVLINRTGRVLKEVKFDRRAKHIAKPKKQTEAIVNYLSDIAEKEKIKVDPLWLPSLEPIIELAQLNEKYKNQSTDNMNSIRALIGEYDDPANQKREEMVLDYHNGNAIIYGCTGSGKLNLIQTAVYSLIENYDSEEINLYLLDFGNETLSAFQDAPQVGDVLTAADTEAVQYLFKMMTDEIKIRKQKFSATGGSRELYIKEKNESIPDMLIIIENYTNFVECFSEFEEYFAQLTREGLKYGIYFIITAVSGNAVKNRIAQNFKQALVLRLNDDSEYSGVLGNTSGVLPSDYFGRGIFKVQDETYEFQTAVINKNKNQIYQNIVDLCEKKNSKNTGKAAKRVPILPEILRADYFKEKDGYPLENLPLGLDRKSLETISVDLSANMIFPVFSSDTVPAIVLDSLTELLNKNTKIIKLDAEARLFPKEGIEETVIGLFQGMVRRNNNYKEALAEEGSLPVFEDWLVTIRNFEKMQKLLSVDAVDKLRKLLENGRPEYRIFFILADNTEGVGEYAFESWYKKQVSGKDGLWIGNGFNQQFNLKANTSSFYLNEELKNDCGYFLNRGQVKSIKTFSD